ncbi:MAG: hypothetical protein AB8B60_03415 [Sulfitobacter sp.]
MIWVLTGAVQRVERFVTHPANAVSGLEQDRVHFAPDETCVPSRSKARNSDRRAARQALMSVALNITDGKFSEKNKGNIRRLSVPSLNDTPDIKDQLDKIRPKAAPEMDRNGKAYDAQTIKVISDLSLLVEERYAGGIRNIDPSRLVARTEVQPLDLLPEPAGFLQMIERGDVVGLPRTGLMIVKQVTHLPPLSHGGGSMRILVKPGVKLDPSSGNLSSYRIFEQGTNACVVGPMCRKLQELK